MFASAASRIEWAVVKQAERVGYRRLEQHGASGSGASLRGRTAFVINDYSE